MPPTPASAAARPSAVTTSTPPDRARVPCEQHPRSQPASAVNLGGWLTPAAGRGSLAILRSRTARREQPLFSFNPAPTAALYTLSLHDALPISLPLSNTFQV